MTEDDTLRYHYEKELALLRRSLRAFADRYPRAAVRLSIVGEHSEDPHVERLLQSFAFLAARISAKLGDDYPEFTEALLGTLNPLYLRPFPSCAIARFGTSSQFDSQTAPAVIDRGTELLSNVGKCSFRTVYDVVLAPLRISAAKYAHTPTAPSHISLPPDTSGLLSITFSSSQAGKRLDSTALPVLRVHLAGTSETVASLTDTMLLRSAMAFVEDGTGRWTPLQAVPIKAAGFGPRESLLEWRNRHLPPSELLAEYFSFADRFHFVDIDLAAIVAAGEPSAQLTLHLAIADVHRDSWAAQRLAPVSAENLQLFCTPVVNLFPLANVPLKYDNATGAWPIEVTHTSGALTEVWALDLVRTDDGRRVPPFTSLAHGSSPGLAGPWWTFMQWRIPESPEKTRPASLTLVDLNGRESNAGILALSVDATCSNGDVPRSLPVGAPGGDLQMEGNPLVGRIALLRPPTPVARLPRGDGALWRLISQQTPHAVNLSLEGLAALKSLFRQFAALSATHSPHIEGIMHLACKPIMEWIVMQPQPIFVRGLEITLTVDDSAFASTSIATFASVMERFFTPYAPETSFVKLIVASANNGWVIRRGEPVAGSAPIV
ncbi:type VI secretion system baseplate subunit TssF [Trinickia caryophylli]|uniref:Type VI secretion system protein ImpG n=1 Tax=Trinickia caryophylli TaxID=28094 RepID=A0A1X7FLN9_TRICW|nr:type VI secretion system baseplate subunit TssF [Trinickia caryophylli]PMS13138.1 type VI secretion system baseplate subunit TssF [Trinickia caryophylli]TRX19339.1 type VI secretion system baseplate subunit TssF [Trinickia caryophylli]WQE13358.1 type VI secretion system baseplate subunit TssF [Trinickia caryophylli]SMF53993.1 type VI secretion system protein ImpG [Trinickia caryophylli]GLU34127.1 hypothetical protein Busp01_39690 [Trinickia caryophylli]